MSIKKPNLILIFFLEKLLDLRNLEPDPTLYASGLSMMFKNDYLNPHIDNSHDAKRKKYSICI